MCTYMCVCEGIKASISILGGCSFGTKECLTPSPPPHILPPYPLCHSLSLYLSFVINCCSLSLALQSCPVVSLSAPPSPSHDYTMTPGSQADTPEHARNTSIPICKQVSCFLLFGLSNHIYTFSNGSVRFQQLALIGAKGLCVVTG